MNDLELRIYNSNRNIKWTIPDPTERCDELRSIDHTLVEHYEDGPLFSEFGGWDSPVGHDIEVLELALSQWFFPEITKALEASFPFSQDATDIYRITLSNPIQTIVRTMVTTGKDIDRSIQIIKTRSDPLLSELLFSDKPILRNIARDILQGEY